MNRPALYKAAYFACLAIDQDPSVRNVAEMVKRISGKGIRLESVRLFLADLKRDTLGIQTEHSRDTASRNKSASAKASITGPDTAGIQPGNLHARAAKVLELEDIDSLPPVANATAPPKGERRREKPIVEDVTFEPDDERRVNSLVALVAAENKSGEISVARVKTLRLEMRLQLDMSGAAAWRYAVDVAIERGAGWRYALAVIKRNPNGAPILTARAPARASPREQSKPKSLQPSEDKLALYAQIGKRHAIRSEPDSLGRVEDAIPPGES